MVRGVRPAFFIMMVMLVGAEPKLIEEPARLTVQ